MIELLDENSSSHWKQPCSCMSTSLVRPLLSSYIPSPSTGPSSYYLPSLSQFLKKKRPSLLCFSAPYHIHFTRCLLPPGSKITSALQPRRPLPTKKGRMGMAGENPSPHHLHHHLPCHCPMEDWRKCKVVNWTKKENLRKSSFYSRRALGTGYSSVVQQNNSVAYLRFRLKGPYALLDFGTNPDHIYIPQGLAPYLEQDENSINFA